MRRALILAIAVGMTLPAASALVAPPRAVGDALEQAAWVSAGLAAPEQFFAATANLGSFEFGLRVAFDHDQQPNPVVAGRYLKDQVVGYQAVLLKFNAQGEIAYQSGVDVGRFDGFAGVDVDAAANAYGAGSALDPATQRWVMLAAKVDSAGTVLWKRTLALDPPTPFLAAADGVLLPGGDFVLAGHASGDSAGADAALARLAPDGTPAWVRRLAAPAEERATALALGPSGYLVLAGERGAGAARDVLVLRTSDEGGVLQQAAFDLGGEEEVFGVAADAAGAMLVSGTLHLPGQGPRGFLLRLAPSLEPAWALAFDLGAATYGGDVAVDRLGNAVLAGRGAPASGPAAGFLAKVAPQGAVLFVRLLEGEALPPHAEPFGVATSPEGLFLATGGFASVGGEARIHATKTLGLSAGGTPAGVVVTALNAQALG